jgi:hypothetical protein
MTVRYREATPQLDVFSLLSHEQAVTQVVKGINKLVDTKKVVFR